MATYREKLREWFKSESKKGLLDMKVYPGEQRDVPIEMLSEEVYKVVTGEYETVDITDELN